MTDPKVVVIGAGPAGLAAALSLARRGRRVTVFERDPVQPIDDPANAYATWSRPGVPHHRLPHSLLGRTRRVLRTNAPDVLAAMLQAGAWENDLGKRLVRDAARPGDEDLVAVHCRRAFFESVLRRAVEGERLVNLVSNAQVEGLILKPDSSGAPQVTGVRMHGGDVGGWDQMAKRLRFALAKEGIAFHQHRFRSTRAQQLHAAGVPDSSIVEMLGWGTESGARMLHRYVGRVPLSTLKSYPPILDRIIGTVA